MALSRVSAECLPHIRGGLLARASSLVLATIVTCWATVAAACPFCTALPRTLSDDLEESTAAVVARCETTTSEEGFHIGRMRIIEVIKGDPKLKDSVVEVASMQKLSEQSVVWLAGYGEDSLQWASPKTISTEGVSYLRSLAGLPKLGPRRLQHFLGFLHHPDDLVAADAYNEFAEASLADIASLKHQLNRQWVIAQLRDVSLPRHHRRLCWTFLSLCGTSEDVAVFDESLQIRLRNPAFAPGMDAAISCFIVLGGEQALARIEREYLANPDAEYLDCFAAASAIRVHGTELNVFPRKRLAKALRHLLSRPELADLVISDLARWEDWSVIDRMVELFENSTEETSFLKPATVLYLKACPLPAAAEAVDRLRAIDPETVRSAESSMMLHSGVASVPVPPPDESAPADTTEPVTPRRP